MLNKKLSALGLALLALLLLGQNVNSQTVDPVELFRELDKNSDGVVTASEVPDEKMSSFDRLLRIGDVNKNKELTQKEVSDALSDDQGMLQKPRKDKSAQGQGNGGRQKAGGRSGQRGSGQNGQSRGQQGGQGRGGTSGSVSPTEMLSRFDENNDGKLTADEIPEQATRLLQMMQDADKNKDKSVSKMEMEEYFSNLRGQGSGQQQGGRRPSGQGSGGSRQSQQSGGQRSGRMQSGQGSQGGGFGQRGGGSGQGGQGGGFGQRGGGSGQGGQGQRGGGFGQGGQGRGGMSISPDAILDRFDTNKDGKLSPNEIPGQAGRLMQMMKDADKNEDGTVTKKELTKYLSSAGGSQPMRGSRPSAGGGGNSRGGRPSSGGGGGSRGGGAFGANLPKVGQSLPDLAAYTADGETVNLSELKGNYSVLVFGCLT